MAVRKGRLLARHFLLTAFSLAGISLFTTSAGGQSAGPLAATVIHVYDGDTLKVRLDSGEERRVRLIGVDSPEYNDPDETSRLWAFLGRRFVNARLYGKPVRLTRDKEETDAYGRLLAFVWTSGGTLFNEVLVEQGFARAYVKYPFDEATKARLKAAEVRAREAGKGLWRRKPFDVIGAPEAAGRTDEVVTVRFRCVRLFDRGDFRVLVPAEGPFEAVCPRDILALFPGSLDFENKVLEVTGLVEQFKGRPQVVIGLPAQVRVAGDRLADPAAAVCAPPFDRSALLVYNLPSGRAASGSVAKCGPDPRRTATSEPRSPVHV